MRLESEKLSYWPPRDMPLDSSRCFLCGIRLDNSTRTLEHVFPRWMLNDVGLWTAKLDLINGTGIDYSKLVIPCCADCNNQRLAALERRVSQSFRGGPVMVEALDQSTLVAWLAKIYFGIHFKEASLPVDRTKVSHQRIIHTDDLKRLSQVHFILQSVLGRVEFKRPIGSVRVFETQVPEDPANHFDYVDLPEIGFLAMRVRNVGIVASLTDWGAMQHGLTSGAFAIAEQLALHPTQFREVAAHGAYIASNMRLEFDLRLDPQGEFDRVEPVVIRSATDDEVDTPFAPYREFEMAAFLAAFTGLEIDDVYDPSTNALWTTLCNENGSLLSVDQGDLTDLPLFPPGYFESRLNIS